MAKCVLEEIENHAHMVRDLCGLVQLLRIHKTLRVTPAMAAGVCDRHDVGTDG
jgi:hypothetical protein